MSSSSINNSMCFNNSFNMNSKNNNIKRIIESLNL